MRQVLLIACLAHVLGAKSPWDRQGQDWWKNVEYLASDDLQGRFVGSRGFDVAASYVAEKFAQIGLLPAGIDGFFQPVYFDESTLRSAKLTISRRNKITNVDVPSEAMIDVHSFTPHEVKARVVFAGYGLQIPELGFDELRGLPLQGAVVAYLTGMPREVTGVLRSHYGSVENRWKAMRAAGAVGMIAIANPNHKDGSWSGLPPSWNDTKIELADSTLSPFEGLKFGATWNPSLADDLFKGSGHSMEDIREADTGHFHLPRFATKCSLTATTSVATRRIRSANIAAVHPGNDGLLRNEYLVVSAHLDHLGQVKTSHGHTVTYNGAMDDASGVASVIEVAKLLKDAPTKRSILFLILTAEEEGELGSAYFARYPTVPGRLAADFNTDMFLPLFPLKWLEVQGVNESSMGVDVALAAAQAGVNVQTDLEPGHERFLRSDQYSFVKAGIPAVAFKFGCEKGSSEEKTLQKWYATRYHSTRDDLNQPVDIEAAAKFNDVLKHILEHVANNEDKPRWKQQSFYRRFADGNAVRITAPGL